MSILRIFFASRVFLHQKKSFLNFFGHVYAWALVHWAFNLPKVIMHALIWKKNNFYACAKGLRLLKL
jgi:hypothetical protein